jgi:hypothetical protein
VELLLYQHIVTGAARAALKRAYHSPQITSELCKKHGWDEGKF